MSMYNSKPKSNKHSGGEIVELVFRPLKTFTLVEPDKVLEGHTIESYKTRATFLLTNFNGALFQKEGDVLTANTDLNKSDILEQQSRKMGVNLHSLVCYLTDNKIKEVDPALTPILYKNLDEFKRVITVELNVITLQQQHWSRVRLKRLHAKDPEFIICFDLDEFEHGDYELCNVIDSPCYHYYVKSITSSKRYVEFIKLITKCELGSYIELYNKFHLDSPEPVTVTFEYDIDLFFSHMNYLYKVIQTFN